MSNHFFSVNGPGICLVIFLSFISWSTAFADGLKDIRVNATANGKTLVQYLSALETKYDVEFIYNHDELDPYQIYGVVREFKLEAFLDVFLGGFYVTKINERVLVLVKKFQFGALGSDRHNYLLVNSEPGASVLLKGRIQDVNTGEPIIGASVQFESSNTGTLTDANGYFEARVIPEMQSITIRYVGYQSSTFIVAFSRFGESNPEIPLFQSSTELESVIIRAEGSAEIKKNQLAGIERLNIKTIKELPTFMGEVDPIRSITTLPGVSTSGELSSGFNVRGGEPGQNLILQDGAIIYNPTHLFGYFSAFNPDLVKDIELYKGGGPASFGGRAASILDINLKNGNLNNHSFSGGVGLVTSRLMGEGPIVRNKASYAVGGRISYSNWLVHSINNADLKNSAAKFYDVNAKIFLVPNENNSITVSGYFSYDDFQLGNDSIFSWDTRNLSLNWDHSYSEELNGKLTLASSNYNSNVTFDKEDAESFFYQNSVNNLGLKYDFALNPSKPFLFNFGLETTYSILNPGYIRPTVEGGNVIARDVEDQKALESALYLQTNYNPIDVLGISVGLRYSQFLRLGQGGIYEFDYVDLDGRYPAIIDSTLYGNGEIISNYGGLSPRLSIRYSLDPQTYLKASYYRSYQYLHLVSNSTTPSPLDYWIASGPYIEPTVSDQYTLGFFRDLQAQKYELSAEGFYKNLDRIVDYTDGADLFLNRSLEAGLAQGTGEAYGVEVQLKKNREKFNGWISYTYSRSLRKFNSEIPTLNLNSGEIYSAINDQPHDVSLIMNYQAGTGSFFSLNFSYKTGRPITIPVSKFSYGTILSVLNYSQRNEYRMPDYHRLDLSYTLKDKPRRNQRYKGEWVFSVYNVYGRKNAYSIYFDEFGMANKLSILGSVFPSITYNFYYE